MTWCLLLEMGKLRPGEALPRAAPCRESYQGALGFSRFLRNRHLQRPSRVPGLLAGICGGWHRSRAVLAQGGGPLGPASCQASANASVALAPWVWAPASREPGLPALGRVVEGRQGHSSSAGAPRASAPPPPTGLIWSNGLTLTPGKHSQAPPGRVGWGGVARLD